MRKCLSLSVRLSLLLMPFCASSQSGYDRTHVGDLFQNNDYEGAIQWLLSPVNHSASPQYQADLGYAYFMNEDFTEAKRSFLLVFQQSPLNLQANLYLARIYEEFRMSDSALFHYLRLTNLRPGNYRYWYKSAQLYTALDYYDAALDCVARGYAANPRSGKLAVQYATLLVKQKLADKADSVLNLFLAVDSTNLEVISKKIDLSAKKSDHRQVIFWGEKLLVDSADLGLPYVNVAYSYLNTDSIAKCIWLCEWLISKNKAYPPVLYCAALAYAKNKQYVTSNQFLDRCLQLSIQNEAITYFNAKSDNFEAMKQYRTAADYHDTSYYLFQSPLDLYYAGRLYDKYFNNKSKAASYYRRFIQKRKKPLTNDEARIFQYIETYLQGPERATEKDLPKK